MAEHVAMIEAIHAAGLKIIAIDNRNELDRAGYGNDIQRRNEHMTEQIQIALRQPRAGRVVVLTGKRHSALVSDESGVTTIPQMLNEAGISNLTFDLESTEEYAPKKLVQAFIHELSKGLLATSGSGDYFLPTPPEDSSVHGVIFISN